LRMAFGCTTSSFPGSARERTANATCKGDGSPSIAVNRELGFALEIPGGTTHKGLRVWMQRARKRRRWPPSSITRLRHITAIRSRSRPGNRWVHDSIRTNAVDVLRIDARIARTRSMFARGASLLVGSSAITRQDGKPLLRITIESSLSNTEMMRIGTN